MKARRGRQALQGVFVTAALMAAAGAILAAVQHLTEERVRTNALAAERQVIRELAGVAATVPDDSLPLCERDLVLRRDTTRGYGGEVDYIVAFAADGRIAGVRVLHHAETPGFADILLPQSDWLTGFGAEDEEVHAVTGATITSRAVIDGVTATRRRHVEAASACPPAPSEAAP
ncbi:MAG: FMN-binding protein [Gammaproteobacteria bacterium]|nr:FMN-binding protein [Gammaproteobacteria bacterium]